MLNHRNIDADDGMLHIFLIKPMVGVKRKIMSRVRYRGGLVLVKKSRGRGCSV